MKKKIELNISTTFVLILSIFIIFVCQYLACIPINLHSAAFVVEATIIMVLLILGIGGKRAGKKGPMKAVVYPLLVVAVLVFFGFFLGAPFSGGLGNYKNQSEVIETDFTSIPEFDPVQVQLVDKNTAEQLGDRVFGTLGSEEVSQYRVGDDWVQISLNGTLYRVTPIDFDGLYKFMVTGTTPGFILVNCQDGKAELVRSEGLRYMKSAYYNVNLQRHLYLQHPFALLGEAKFELDESRTPYWVTPVYKVTWIEKTKDIKGVYITDPVSGKSTYYDKEDVPSWVDNVYPVSVIYRQFRESKRYENGLFNFSNRGVVEFTDDYAYVQFNDDVCIYTGVTSVGKDESNVGFAYVDLRDGRIAYVRRAGAEEYSARSSAEGALQQYNYRAIFPSMVNVRNIPTYFMGLVDGANLIKSYAFVSYENYQLVATGTTVEEAYSNYLRLLGEEETSDDTKTEVKQIDVDEVRIITDKGSSIVLIMAGDRQIYWYDMSGGDYRMSFLKKGDILLAEVNENNAIRQVVEIYAE